MALFGEVAGPNGVVVQDVGNAWRAVGVESVRISKVLDYEDREGRLTGIKYAIGPDTVTGDIKIAYVDYDKSRYDKEFIETDPAVPLILDRCNVCAAMNQIAREKTSGMNINPIVSDQTLPAIVGSVHSIQPAMPSNFNSQQPYPIPDRVSIGNAVQPKYVPVLFNLGKKLFLSDAGDAIVSVAASLLADLMSGWSQDPGSKHAWRCISDGMMDGVGCDEHAMSKYREDMAKIMDAYQRDGDFVSSFRRGLFKSASDIRNGIGVDITTSKTTKRRVTASPVYGKKGESFHHTTLID